MVGVLGTPNRPRVVPALQAPGKAFIGQNFVLIAALARPLIREIWLVCEARPTAPGWSPHLRSGSHGARSRGYTTNLVAGSRKGFSLFDGAG